MYARSTMRRGDPQNLDARIAYVRDEVMPMLQQLDGFVGLSMLIDRESGRSIVTSSWESEEAMANSEEAATDARQRMAERDGAEPQVDRWEVAMMHRAHAAHDGACARVIWNEGDPARADEIMSTFRTAMLPRVEALPGFCSLSLLRNVEQGRAAATVTYDSRENMQRVSEQGAAMREEFSRDQKTRVTDVAEFDVVLHHLRVPELI